MRKLIGGNYRAKLAAMWEGPFEFYVWLDSDAIVWGDFTSQVRTDVDFQIFWSEISIPVDAAEVPAWLPHYYFDPGLLRQFDAIFDWRGHPYFSAGVYACRRNAISYPQWVEVDSWNGKVPRGLFKFGDMGILNYLVHAQGQRGTMRVATTNLQHICGHHGITELAWPTALTVDGISPNKVVRPRVIHFCGRKPLLFDRNAYSRPFTIARLANHRRNHGNTGAWLAVLNEEGRVLASKLKEEIGSQKLKISLKMTFSIMITTKNRASDLRRTLQMLQSLDPVPLEILITADGCTDETVQMLKAETLKTEIKNLKIIVNEIGRGSVASRDRMMREARGDLVLALDDDSYPEQANCLQFLSSIFHLRPSLAIATFPQRTDEYPETLTQSDFGHGATGPFVCQFGRGVAGDIHLSQSAGVRAQNFSTHV